MLPEVTQKLYVPSPVITLERSASTHVPFVTEPSEATIAEL
jgi:hypothetical protein